MEAPFQDSAIRDTWVLIAALVSWCLLIGSWALQSCCKKSSSFVENHAGILVRRSIIHRGQSMVHVKHVSSSPNLQKKRSASDRLAEFIFEIVHDEDGSKCEGLHRPRTLALFLEGKAPPRPGTSFQEGYRTSSRAVIYWLLLHGALPRCFRFVTVVGVLAMTLTWLLRNDLEKHLHTEILSYDAISGNMKAAYQVQYILLPLASFLLALYINMKLNWFMSIIDLCWGVQGQLHNFALILGSTLLPQDDLDIMKTKFTAYRYLNLIHFYLYQATAVEFHNVGIEDMRRCGLVLGGEKALLENAVNPRSLVTLWLATMVQQLQNDGRLDSHVQEQLLDAVTSLRRDGDTLVKELTRMAPISFAQLLQLMIDILLLLTPPALSHTLESQREGVTVYLWPAFGSMVTALFYQGGMRLITAMEYPFGCDLDDLRPQWALMSSELAIFGYLTAGPPPPSGSEPDESDGDDLQQEHSAAPHLTPVLPVSLPQEHSETPHLTPVLPVSLSDAG